MNLDLEHVLKKKKINSFVFIKKKLASADIASLLLFDYYIKTKSKFTYYVREKKTFNEIKNNEVINSFMSSSGELKYINYNKYLTKFSLIFLTYFNLLFKRNFYIFTTYDNTFLYSHFFLNTFFKKKIFYIDVWFVDLPDNLKKLFNNQDRNTNIKSKFNNNYLIFSKNREVKKYNNYVLNNPYLNKNLQNVYKDFFFKKKFYNKNKKYIFYALRTFGNDDMMSSKYSNLNLFKKTIEILNKIDEDIVVLLKPHFITDENLLIEELRKFDKSKFKITYLHPMSLIPYCKLFISNFYTLTMNFARICEVPVIEYTDYSLETKKIILNQPIDPLNIDYFYNYDEHDNLCKKIISILKF